MDKRPFLETKQEWGIALLILGGIFLASLFYHFLIFHRYISGDKQTLQGRIIQQYLKNDKWVLKIKTDQNLILYATSKEHLKDLVHKRVLLFGKPAKCGFLQSFKNCFFVLFSMDLLHNDWRESFYQQIQKQHHSPLMTKFYETLFFASSLPKEWREVASRFKIAHLLAISGLHLGILAFVLYGILGGIYRFFQARFFTYRNRIFDLGVIISLILLGYLFLLDFPPSFVRAYVMSILGLLFVYYHFSLMNFLFLFFCCFFILSLFPSFVFSIGFWFSFAGVFYIFLFFKYFKFRFHPNRWVNGGLIAVALNSVLYLNMLPLTHLFFPSFSLYSLVAIPVSIVFPFLFIGAIGLHCLGLGGVFDKFLLQIFDLKPYEIDYFAPIWFILSYLILSGLAIGSSRFYYCVLGSSVLFCVILGIKTF